MSPTSSLALNVTWTWPVTILLLLAALLPIYGPMLPTIEGYLLPVTSKIQIVNPAADPSDAGSMLFTFTYTKYRACEYLGTEARVKGLHVDFENTEAANITRVPGPQISQVWRLRSTDLADLAIYFIHRCSPYWITITRAYP
jgi:hypothetical protein